MADAGVEAMQEMAEEGYGQLMSGKELDSDQILKKGAIGALASIGGGGLQKVVGKGIPNDTGNFWNRHVAEGFAGKAGKKATEWTVKKGLEQPPPTSNYVLPYEYLDGEFIESGQSQP